MWDTSAPGSIRTVAFVPSMVALVIKRLSGAGSNGSSIDSLFQRFHWVLIVFLGCIRGAKIFLYFSIFLNNFQYYLGQRFFGTQFKFWGVSKGGN